MAVNDYRNYLMHHGILGQKWGVRRYQNADGSWTSLGRKHRGLDVNIEQAKQKYASAKELYSKKHSKQNKANFELAKKQLEDEKIKEKLNSEKKMSKTREKLENKYREQGMSKEEAAIAAYKNVRTRKILAGIGGVAAAAAIGYAGYKIYKHKTDEILFRFDDDKEAFRPFEKDNAGFIKDIKGVRDAFHDAWSKNTGLFEENDDILGFYEADPYTESKVLARRYLPKTGKRLAIAAGVVAGGTNLIKAAKQRSDNKAIRKYREEHLNTELSNNEILKTLKR